MYVHTYERHAIRSWPTCTRFVYAASRKRVVNRELLDRAGPAALKPANNVRGIARIVERGEQPSRYRCTTSLDGIRDADPERGSSGPQADVAARRYSLLCVCRQAGTVEFTLLPFTDRQ